MVFQHRILGFPAVETAESLVDPDDLVVLTGSCFSENIGNRLRELYHPVVINPLGIAFDPVSLLKHFKQAFYPHEPDYIFERDGVYLSWLHHSVLYAGSRELLIEKLLKASQVFKNSVIKARLIVITLGTAFHYVLKREGFSVANCHKMPSDIFDKKLLTAADIENALEEILSIVVKWNDEASVIFTVSPVKHIRDGVVQNTRSKAHLLTAVHAVADRHKQVFYFPAYEIVTDVLRNYEYYEDDMAHPSTKAVEVIFEYFLSTWFTETSKNRFKRIEQFVKNLKHQIRIPEAESARKWFVHLKNEKEHLQKEFGIELSHTDKERWKAISALFEHQ